MENISFICNSYNIDDIIATAINNILETNPNFSHVQLGKTMDIPAYKVSAICRNYNIKTRKERLAELRKKEDINKAIKLLQENGYNVIDDNNKD